ITQELMRQCDLILATGGAGMVKSAYSSGKPAYGVGVGNAVVVVDETADIKDAANKVMRSKTFDYATSCSAENSLVIQESIYDDMNKALEDIKEFLHNQEEKAKIKSNIWIDRALKMDIIAKEAKYMKEIAGL